MMDEAGESIAPGWTMRVAGPMETGGYYYEASVVHEDGESFSLRADVVAVKELPDEGPVDWKAWALREIKETYPEDRDG